MDFTREPIIETVITPKEGYKLVVRSSKNSGQEEYFVDAVEVVSFGQALFFRSIEKPKCFLVPISDYEVLEVREARMVLKNVGVDQSIKIGGGRETHIRAPREQEKEEAAVQSTEGTTETPPGEAPLAKKRERRRHSRRRRGHEEAGQEASKEEGMSTEDKRLSAESSSEDGQGEPAGAPAPLLFSSLLQPPPTLISETIGRYKETFKEAFFTPEGEVFIPHGKVEELLGDDEEEKALAESQEVNLKESLHDEGRQESEPETLQESFWEEEGVKNQEPQYPSKDE